MTLRSPQSVFGVEEGAILPLWFLVIRIVDAYGIKRESKKCGIYLACIAMRCHTLLGNDPVMQHILLMVLTLCGRLRIGLTLFHYV